MSGAQRCDKTRNDIVDVRHAIIIVVSNPGWQLAGCEIAGLYSTGSYVYHCDAGKCNNAEVCWCPGRS